MASSFRSLLGLRPSTASTADSTLLIIDAQNEYASGLLRTEDVDATRRAIAALLDRYRRAGGSIVHVVHAVPAGAPVFTPGTALAEEMAAVAARGAEKVVVKQHPGAFSGTGLEEVLRAEGKRKVLITGYMAHVCVSTTARQAAERGFDVLLAEDAIGDRNIPGADAADVVKMVLAELADAFGTVIQGSSVV